MTLKAARLKHKLHFPGCGNLDSLPGAEVDAKGRVIWRATAIDNDGSTRPVAWLVPSDMLLPSEIDDTVPASAAAAAASGAGQARSKGV